MFQKSRILAVAALTAGTVGLFASAAYAGTYTLGDKQVIHHIDISWNQGWTGTDQLRFFELEGDTLTITTAPYRSYQDGKEGRSILVWDRVPTK